MNLADQLAVFDDLADRAYEMALDAMASNHHRIKALARERLVRGEPVFGDVIFRQHPEVLYQEGIEECADLLNYHVALMHRIRERGRSRPQAAVA